MTVDPLVSVELGLDINPRWQGIVVIGRRTTHWAAFSGA
jgi:hypothetical protein